MNDITVYMHGGNVLSGHLGGDTNDEWLELFNDDGVVSNGPYGFHWACFRIYWNHVDRIEFTSPRSKTGFEFIGLD